MPIRTTSLSINLYWDGDEAGFREEREGEGFGEMRQYDLNVDSCWSAIFYLNTWDETAGVYTKTAVIPQAGDNLVISTCKSDNSGIAASAKNPECFVNISSTETIDAVTSSVTYGDLSLTVTISALPYGFFSSTEPSWETYLPVQFDLDGSKAANAFYWIYRDGAAVSDVQIHCSEDFSDIEKFFPKDAPTEPVTLSKVSDKVSDKVYKLTVNENLVNWGKYNPYFWFSMNLNADISYGDESEYPGTAYNSIGIFAQKSAKEYALIDVDDRSYCFYDDGVVFCNYPTDEDEASDWENAPVVSECFVNSTNEAIQLPEGFHYDYNSNTLTLEDATLDNLYIGYAVTTDNESILHLLPKANLTLVLEGNNTINSRLFVYESTYVTLAGAGTLTLNGTGIISKGTTLDMETNGQTILLGRNGYVDNQGTLKGETQNVADSNPVVARFLLEESTGIGHQYRYYADGTSQVYARNITQWDETNASIAPGFAYNVATNTLTLTDATIHKLDLTANGLLPGKKLTISLVGGNTINYLTVSDGNNVTIQGSGSLNIGATVAMTNGGAVTLNPSATLCLPSHDAMQMDGSATFTGTLSYTEGTSYIAYRALSQQNDGTAFFEDETYYGMGGAGLMGMQERLLVFYKANYTDGQWVYTPVKPTGYGRIRIADYTGAVGSDITDAEKAAAVVMTSTDLGGGSVTLTIDGKQFDWTLYDLHVAYYSSATPSSTTYLSGESQHYFDTTKGGSNTFYFIARETDTGIQVQDDVTWNIDTWGEDYTAFIPGLGKTEDLVTIEEVTVSSSGNRVWKITVSNAFVDYVNYAYNWKNFQLVPHVTWEYTGNPGESEVSDYWAMIINPPQKTLQPTLRLSLCKDNHADLEGYQFYSDTKVYHDGKEATLPTGVTWDGTKLTLDNASLDGICLGGFEEAYTLNLELKGENTINSLHTHDNHTVNVTGDGTLTVTGALRVFDQTSLSFPDNTLILGADCDTEIWGNVSGEFGYASGYSEIALYVLWDDALSDGSFVPTFHGPFTLEEYTCMGMNTASVLFLKKTRSEEGWTWQPVKPTAEDSVTIADYTTDYQGTYYYRNGYDGDFLEEDPAWADDATSYTVDITPNLLGDERVTLSFGDKTCDWYVEPLAWGFFSQPEAILDNYFKGDAQHCFDTTKGGSNTFYFITLNALCGFTVDGVTWNTDTWGQDYSCFGEELVTVTQVDSDSKGNRVWKITVSDGYVNLACRYGMWMNFSLNMSAGWVYPGGGRGGVGGWSMFINPPAEQLMPTAAFRIDDYDYHYYADVPNQILKMGQDEKGNPDVSWVTELPKGVAYDVQSNTMTLTNAQLQTLMFWYDSSWTDEEGNRHTEILLPKSTLTLNLVGESTLATTDRNVLFAYGGCHVVITGTGTLNLETTNTFQSGESFSTLWLASGSTLTIGGSATVNLSNKTDADTDIRMYGINGDGTGTLTLRDSATLNLPASVGRAYTNDEVTFTAINVGTLTMEGGTINARGELDVENLTVSGGTINQTSNRAEGFWVINGSISGGELNLTGAGLGVSNYREDIDAGASFDISGGKITITGTDAVSEMYEYAGLTNYGYLSVNGGELIVNMPDNVAIKNFGTFHQTGGKVTLTSDGDAALRSSGAVLLNSGTMDITGPVGIYQINEENLNWTDKPEERFLQVGGGTGDHQLTIHATGIGIRANGVVELTGQCQVDIQVTGETGCGILAESYKQLDVQQTNVRIHMAAKLNVNATSIGILAQNAPVSIFSDSIDGIAVAPTVTLYAPNAVAEERTEETSNFTFGEGIGLYSARGAGLSQWGAIGDGFYYLLNEDGNAATGVEFSQADETKGLFAQFADIDGRQYRIYEKDGVQTVYTLVTGETESRWVEDTLPQGVSYDLTTNTLTLAKNASLTSLYADNARKTMGQVTTLLPSRDLTIRLSSKATIDQLTLGSGLNTTLTGGTLTLTGNSSVMSTLTVAKGAGLTINAGFAVYTRADSDDVVGSVGKLIVEKGAKLTNNNVIDLQCDLAVYVDVQGTFSQGKNGVTTVGWNQRENITGNLTQTYQTLVCHLSSEEALDQVLALETLSKYKQVDLCTSQLTLTKDYEIPANAEMYPINEDATLTIHEGATLAIKGFLGFYTGQDKISSIVNNGTIRLDKGGILHVHGNFSGNAPVNNGGKIYPQASKVTVTASATAFDLYDWETREGYSPLTLAVNVETKDAETPLNRVTWTSSNKKVIDPDDIRDNQDGTYTVTEFRGTGKVTLTATTIDGTKKTAKVTLNVTYLGSDKLTATTTDSVFEGLLQVDELVTMEVCAGETMVNRLHTSYYTNLVEEVEEDGTQGRSLAITFKSSNTKVAEVDVYGNIIGKKAGSAKITATMNIPGDKRTVSITVKVVDPQILRVNLYDRYYYDDEYLGDLYHVDYGNTIFDLADLNENADLRTLKIFAGQLTWNNEMDMEEWQDNPDEYIPASKLKWACSDTSVATVKTHKDGYAIVTIKKGAHGMFTITATATDTNKAVGSATFIVKDYSPRFSNPSITLNPKLEGGVKLELVESYENTISSVTFVPDSTKNEGKLEVVSEEDIGYIVQAILDEDGKLANQTIKGKLHIETDNGLYTLNLTVAVKNTEPKITVYQDTTYGKLDLTYRDNYACILYFGSSTGWITRVELAEGSSPDIEFGYYDWGSEEADGNGWVCKETYTQEEYENCVFFLRMAANCGSKINTKVKFNVYVEGYQTPILCNFTPKTTTSKLTLTTNPTASVINGNGQTYSVSFGLKRNGSDLRLWGDEDKVADEDGYIAYEQEYYWSDRAEVVSVTYNGEPLDFTVAYDRIHLTFDKETYPKGFNGTVKVELKNINWSQHKTISHKISTNTKAPTVTVSTPTLTLYTKFPKNQAVTDFFLSQSNLQLVGDVEIVKCSSNEGLKLDVDPWGDMIFAGFQLDGEDYVIPKAGTYTFTAKAYYVYDLDAYYEKDEEAKAVQFTFKVKVVSTEPSIKLSAKTIKLNTALAGLEEGHVYANVNWNDLMLSGNGYLTLKGYEINGEQILFPEGYWEWNEATEKTEWVGEEPNYYIDEANGIRLTAREYTQSYGDYGSILANLTRADAKKATYTIYPIVYDYNFEQYYTLSTKLSLTVQPHSSKISVTTSVSGKLDLQIPIIPVTYTLKKVNNAIWDNVRVTLLKKDGKDYVPYEEGEEPLFYLESWGGNGISQMVDLYLNNNIQYTAGKTEQFKLRYYFGDGEDAPYVDSPVLSQKLNQSAAKITASTVNYYQAEGEGVTKNIQLNLTSPAGTFIDRVEINEKKTSKELLTALTPVDGDWRSIQFTNPSALKAGKSYSLYLDVYPFTLATTQKPTTVKVTVKVAK